MMSRTPIAAVQLTAIRNELEIRETADQKHKPAHAPEWQANAPNHTIDVLVGKLPRVGVAWCVNLGHNTNAAQPSLLDHGLHGSNGVRVVLVGWEGALSHQLGDLFGAKGEGLVIGQVPVQHIELLHSHCIQQRHNGLDRYKVTA